MVHKLEITYEVKCEENREILIEKEYYDFDIRNINNMFDEYGNLCLAHIDKYNKIKEINGVWIKYKTIKGTLIKNHNIDTENNMSCQEYIWAACTNNNFRKKSLV